MDGAVLIIVAPIARSEAFGRKGFTAVRTNGLDRTMFMRFNDEDAAMIAGRKLDVIWSVEQCPAR